MNPVQTIVFYFSNSKWERKTLRRWKSERRIPEDYCGPLRDIAFWVEQDYKSAKSLVRLTPSTLPHLETCPGYIPSESENPHLSRGRELHSTLERGDTNPSETTGE
jgi:hypothetical protein